MEKPEIKISFLRFYLACFIVLPLGPLFAPSSLIALGFLTTSMQFQGFKIALFGIYFAGFLPLVIWSTIFLTLLILFGKKLLICSKLGWLITGGTIGIFCLPFMAESVVAGSITALLFRQALLTPQQRQIVFEYQKSKVD